MASTERLHGFTPPRGVEHEQWARILTRAFKTLRGPGRPMTTSYDGLPTSPSAPA